MKLFHGSKANKKLGGVLTHFGSMLAAAQRLESIFVTQGNRTFNGREDLFIVLNYDGRPVRQETFPEALQAFVESVKGTVIVETDLDIKKPLRLTDCWMDDPIGSGGPDIFTANTDLSNKQRKSLKALFHPFSGIIYPQDVYNALSPELVRSTYYRGMQDKNFQSEFQKRRERSLAIGEDFARAAAQEIIWVDLTLKLRDWALQKGFDSFVYKNVEEGAGEDTYVTLEDSQILKDNEVYKFSSEAYLSVVTPIFSDFMKENWESGRRISPGHSIHTDTFWAGQDPRSFWKKITPA